MDSETVQRVGLGCEKANKKPPLIRAKQRRYMSGAMHSLRVKRHGSSARLALLGSGLLLSCGLFLAASLLSCLLAASLLSCLLAASLLGACLCCFLLSHVHSSDQRKLGAALSNNSHTLLPANSETRKPPPLKTHPRSHGGHRTFFSIRVLTTSVTYVLD